jgi:iron complex transport system ATP-binding protein
MALAQQPELLLLDEPTANLDIAHQLALLRLIRDLSRARQLTVLAAIHDLNLAALCFDRIVALHHGQIVADGSPGEVLRPETIEAIYGAPVRVVDHPTEPIPLVALTWPTG